MTRSLLILGLGIVICGDDGLGMVDAARTSDTAGTLVRLTGDDVAYGSAIAEGASPASPKPG